MNKCFTFAVVVFMAVPLLAADGDAVFKAKCIGCHGAEGRRSNPSMGIKPLSSPDIQAKSNAELIASVTKGVGRMPGFGGKLSAEEIAASVSFVKGLK